MGNQAFGSGAGISFDCSSLLLTGGTVSNNMAVGGRGGGMEIGGRLGCSGEDPIFHEVAFKGNSATTGGVVYFGAPFPPCAIPVVADGSGRWNASAQSPWHWDDFHASVSGNSATLGDLQATSPVAIVGKLCPGQTCQAQRQLTIEGFPGMSLSFEAMLLDSFDQMTIDDTLQVELVVLPGSTCMLDGPLQHRITQGVAVIQSVKILAEMGEMWNSVCRVLVRLPISIITLRKVLPMEVHVKMGISALDCPPGWISSSNTNVAHSARQCEACPAGTFVPAGAVSCTVGT